MRQPFKPKNTALLMALAAAYPLVAHSAAGVTQFTAGDVNVRRGNSATPLLKGQPIESGDNIVTGGGGQAQIRFSDGGLVSLAPNSQFNIANYSDANDPGKDSFAVNLFRGGMRAITGLIGKRNRDNYKVTTNTATIGIRGSGFSANYNEDGSLTVAGEQDAIVVCTNAGCVELTVGEVARVTTPDTIPSRTALRTNLPPLAAQSQFKAELNQPEIVLADDQVINGTLPGLSAIFTSSDEGHQLYSGSVYGGYDPSNGSGTFVSSELVKFVSPSEGTIVIEKTGNGVATFGTLGTADDPGFIGWGYWDSGRLGYAGASGVIAAEDEVLNLFGVHYIVGRPTPHVQMPQTGTAHYSLVGYTAPTAVQSDGYTYSRVVGRLDGAGMNVDFGTGYLNVVVNTHFVKDGYAVDYQISDFGYISGGAFHSIGTLGSTGYFSGFFTGNQAARAGLLYGGEDDFLGTVSGAAAFIRTGAGDAIDDGSGLKALYTSTDASGSDEAIFTTSPRSDPLLLVSKQLILQGEGGQGGYCGGSFCVAATSSVSSSGSLGNVSDPDFIGWGYWARGVKAYGGGSNVLTGVHYLVGRPTSIMPTVGTATYNMVGGTAPTATYGGVSIVGTLLSAQLQVDFGSNQLDASASTRFVKNGVQSDVHLFVSGATITGSRFSGSGCGGTVSGMFVGANAAKAGMVYQQDSGSNLGKVTGAVALERGAIAP